MRLPEKDGSIDLAQVCDMVDAYMKEASSVMDK